MSDITVNNFKAFYEQIRPYLGAVHSGFTPIGTVISVMGTTAPLNYLACDGTVYNIADYPELASYFADQFESANFFGGDGTTTFAVPDLRGEFLRGTGTNSHANQGSGANVGVHQDGTEHIFLSGGDSYIATCKFGADMATAQVNADSFGGGTAATKFITAEAGSAQYNQTYTSRPTNTSVLYCIASKNIFMDAGSNYSTEEQVVGTWIDGKPIYQKTINIGALPNNTVKEVNLNIDNVDVIFIKNAFGMSSNKNGYPIPYANASSLDFVIQIWLTYPKINVLTRNDYSLLNGYVTLQYTKTTDS